MVHGEEKSVFRTSGIALERCAPSIGQSVVGRTTLSLGIKVAQNAKAWRNEIFCIAGAYSRRRYAELAK